MTTKALMNPKIPVAQVDVYRFVESMPAGYSQVFGLWEAEQHARIVARRGTEVAHAGLWRTLNGMSVICVVADDRPGLLSLITRALVAHRLDVSSAQIYRRDTGAGVLEAVDFFWLRPTRVRTPREVHPEELSSFIMTLRELVERDAVRSTAGGDSIPPLAPVPAPVRAFFDAEALERGDSVLVVEAPDTPGLLLAITLALHRQGIDILGSRVQTIDKMARDSFQLIGPGGAPLNVERLAEVQQAVVAAIRGGGRS